jgi:hypothetical protein
MIVQITITRNELFLIKELMPQWKKYADGFVFMLDRCDDGTYEYLMENKEKFNILSIIYSGFTDEELSQESSTRQRLYDEALQYTDKIICLDTDEYLDGTLTKEQLEQILNQNKDTLFHLQWIQYTGVNEIRTDGPWKYNLKDRLGCYSERAIFKDMQMHSEHLPVPKNQLMIQVPYLFIAHLQWLDKPTVAVKQYYWKICDYITRNKYNTDTIPKEAYDASVNNFNWKYENFEIPLKVNSNIYSLQDIQHSYKYKFIKEKIKEFNIPNLNDWRLNIHE